MAIEYFIVSKDKTNSWHVEDEGIYGDKRLAVSLAKKFKKEHSEKQVQVWGETIRTKVVARF